MVLIVFTIFLLFYKFVDMLGQITPLQDYKYLPRYLQYILMDLLAIKIRTALTSTLFLSSPSVGSYAGGTIFLKVQTRTHIVCVLTHVQEIGRPSQFFDDVLIGVDHQAFATPSWWDLYKR